MELHLKLHEILFSLEHALSGRVNVGQSHAMNLIMIHVQ